MILLTSLVQHSWQTLPISVLFWNCPIRSISVGTDAGVHVNALLEGST